MTSLLDNFVGSKNFGHIFALRSKGCNVERRNSREQLLGHI